MRARVLGAIGGLLALAACNNPCQEVCVRMATYAEECGFKVPESELDTCLDDQADVSPEDKDLCRDFGDLETIRRQWDCDDIAPYWEATTGG